MHSGKSSQALQSPLFILLLSKPATDRHPFLSRLPTADPPLYASLANAELVIFKGDLNYRKLTYDGQWRHTVSFTEAIGTLGEKIEDDDGIRILALRTSKADVAVGLPEGVVETLPHNWTRSGEYAMISFSDTKSRFQQEDITGY